MLKKRVIPLLLLRNGRMVKGTRFENFRHTGLAHSSLRVLTAQDADEIILLQIGDGGVSELQELLELVSRECAVPLAVGGGLKDVEQARLLLKAGADKVIVTSSLWDNPAVITQIASEFGAQAIVGGIEYRVINERPQSFAYRGTIETGMSVIDAAAFLVELGVGEIFLNSIDRDGTMEGLDLQVTSEVCESVLIPVISSGGVGNVGHLVEAFQTTTVDAVACSSIFNFGDNTPIRIRTVLRQNSVPVRRTR